MRDFFKKNLGLKLASLLMALSLEIWFMSPQNLALETISAAVEIHSLPEDKVVVWPPAAEEGLLVDFKIRGPGPLVQEIKDTPKKFIVVIPPKPPSTYIANLDPADLNLPKGVELLEIKPAKFEFRIEDLVKKDIKVTVSQLSAPKEGFRLEGIETNIARIFITGPRGELSQIDTAETEDMDISQLSESTEMEVPFKPIGSRVLFDRRTVTVTVKIAPIEAERAFSGVKVGLNAPDGFAASVSPSKVNVVLTGREDLLANLSLETIDLVADLTQVKAETKEKLFQSAKISATGLPQGVRLLRTDPLSVEVTLFKKGKL